MCEQVYDKDAVRRRAVAHLRQLGRHQTTGQVAVALGVQFWAAEGALHDAMELNEANFHAGVGWHAAPDLVRPHDGETGAARQRHLASVLPNAGLSGDAE